jgi:hypothetical protein
MSGQLSTRALVAGMSLYAALRRRADESSRPASLAAGLVAAGAVVALAQLAGTDPRALYSGGEPRLVPSLLASISRSGRAPDV